MDWNLKRFLLTKWLIPGVCTSKYCLMVARKLRNCTFFPILTSQSWTWVHQKSSPAYPAPFVLHFPSPIVLLSATLSTLLQWILGEAEREREREKKATGEWAKSMCPMPLLQTLIFDGLFPVRGREKRLNGLVSWVLREKWENSSIKLSK